MKIINRKILVDFKQRHADARKQVDSWEAEASEANWNLPQEIKKRYTSASFLPNSQVVFNIKGNKYRLWVQISYNNLIIFIKNIGTHDEYMKWKIN
jgi:mRNA interferase HigB